MSPSVWSLSACLANSSNAMVYLWSGESQAGCSATHTSLATSRLLCLISLSCQKSSAFFRGRKIVCLSACCLPLLQLTAFLPHAYLIFFNLFFLNNRKQSGNTNLSVTYLSVYICFIYLSSIYLQVDICCSLIWIFRQHWAAEPTPTCMTQSVCSECMMRNSHHCVLHLPPMPSVSYEKSCSAMASSIALLSRVTAQAASQLSADEASLW